jgi:hypothetical protein
MAATVYRVEGSRELRRMLRRLSDDNGKALLADLKGELRQVADVVANRARAGAPRRSGRTVALVRSSATTTRATVSVRLAYAGPVHWGWPSRPNAARGWRGGPIKANPWISEAATDTELRWLAMYEGALRALIERLPDSV